MKFKTYLFLVVTAVMTSQLNAATTYLTPGSDVIAAVAAAHAGDTVVLEAGTYTFTSPINLPSGVTLTGASFNSTHVYFNLPGGSTSYGIVFGYNATNTTVEQLDIHSNHGAIAIGNGQYDNNCTITYNNFQYGNGELPSGTIVFGIFETLATNNLQLTHNYFHDSTMQGSRNWNIWYASNSNIDYNLFYNIIDGGQISDAGSNLSLSHNYGTLINRMGQEAGLDSSSSLIIDGNVFYNWSQPYPDSDALSIVGPSGQITYSNNFFEASIAPGSGWGPPDGSGTHRFGYAIEGTGEPALVTGNTFVGGWMADFSSTMVNAQIWDNTVWGGAWWGDWVGEPGPYGYGSCVAWSNNMNNSASGAPNPPTNTWAGPNFGSGASSSSAPAPANAPSSALSSSPATSTNISTPSSSGGALSGSQSAAAASYNLTSAGSTDWAHWGRNGSAGNFDVKADGNGQISDVTTVGSGGYGGYSDSSRNCSWSDGAPATSDGGDDGYIWANNNTGAGYSFNVAASTTQHTLYVYCGGYSSGSTLTAHLSDGSAADYSVSSSGSSHYSNVIAITYKAASAGQTLTITYTKSSNINGSGGSADLIAAWLN